jgi:hypothetical protein
VRIRCGATKGSSRCKGTVVLKSGRTTLGTRTFSVPAGKTTSVTVTLTRTGYALLTKRGSLRTSVTVKARDSAGRMRTRTAKVTLKAPRKAAAKS